MNRISFSKLLPGLLLITLLVQACHKPEIHRVQGVALGTYYAVTYCGNENPEIQRRIDSVLTTINHEFSVFDSTSLLSQYNRNEQATLTPEMLQLAVLSVKVSEQTNGAFDPTAGPLVRQWGFWGKQGLPTDSAQVDSIRQFVGFGKLKMTDSTIEKQDNRIMLDFNAIAKGYAVDCIAEMMRQSGYTDFLVDVGGEIRACGLKNASLKQRWNLGIQVPTETKDGLVETNYIFEAVTDGGRDLAVATSGNYRNYKEKDGKRYSHIINPVSGYSETSELLSVTVICSALRNTKKGECVPCATADAYATAFMVMGMNASLLFLKQHPEMAAHFIYYENGQYRYRQTNNFPKKVR